MLDVSAEYRETMKEQFPEPTDIEILWKFVDEDAAYDMTSTTNTESFPSEVQKISRYHKYYHYAMCENKGYKLGAGQLVIPDNKYDILYQGFESETLSDENGIFIEQPYVDMTFTTLHRTKGLILEFDPLLMRHPQKIYIQAWNNSVSIVDGIYNIDAHRYIVDTDFDYFNRLKITWLESTEPFQRARLSHIMFGIEILFTKDMIELSSGVSQSEDIDPIGRRLPTRRFSFNFINLDKMYDPDNPSGIWRYIDTKTIIDVTYIQHMKPKMNTWESLRRYKWEDLKKYYTWYSLRQTQAVELLNGGRYVLDSMPIIDGIKITINATGIIATLTEIYYKSKNYLQGYTLYDLAVDVLTDAKRIPDEYYLDESLKNYSTTGFLPHIAHNNCLKLIAEAGMCRLYEDRNGVIRIEPNNKIEFDFKMDFWDMKYPPKNEPSPQLQGITTTIYSYAVETEISELAKAEIIAAPEMQKIIFSNSENISYSGSAVIENILVYGGVAFFRCISGGNIVFMGNKIIKTENKRDFVYDEKGLIESINNPLITDNIHGEKLTAWKADWLKNRNTYYYNHYGDPSIESNDLFSIQTDFDDNMPIRILKSDIFYRGALSGSIIAKKVN